MDNWVSCRWKYFVGHDVGMFFAVVDVAKVFLLLKVSVWE